MFSFNVHSAALDVSFVCARRLCGYPPFYSQHGAAISPGMKTRIRSGQYDFPPNEWSHVSPAAKNLIQSLLKTNPAERFTIEQVFNDPWITDHTTVPQTPLCTQAVLREEQSNWPELQDAMNDELNKMRVDTENAMQLKPLPQTTSKLLQKRKEHVGSAALASTSAAAACSGSANSPRTNSPL